MHRIPISGIEDGMVLAVEVLDERGGMLLSAGDRLRKSYTRKLRAWGVKEVTVAGEDSAPDEPDERSGEMPALPVEMKERILRKISHRYEKVGDEPLMKKLMRLSQKHVLNRAARRCATE